MLIATITALILIFGGSSLEFYLTNLKKPVKEHVADKDRRDAILDAGKNLENELKDLRKEIEENFEHLVRIHGKYESTPADYMAGGEGLMADQRKMATLILDARDTMREHTTREEWEAIFADAEEKK